MADGSVLDLLSKARMNLERDRVFVDDYGRAQVGQQPPLGPQYGYERVDQAPPPRRPPSRSVYDATERQYPSASIPSQPPPQVASQRQQQPQQQKPQLAQRTSTGGGAFRGLGEHDDRKRQLEAERQAEYKKFLEQQSAHKRTRSVDAAPVQAPAQTHQSQLGGRAREAAVIPAGRDIRDPRDAREPAPQQRLADLPPRYPAQYDDHAPRRPYSTRERLPESEALDYALDPRIRPYSEELARKPKGQVRFREPDTDLDDIGFGLTELEKLLARRRNRRLQGIDYDEDEPRAPRRQPQEYYEDEYYQADRREPAAEFTAANRNVPPPARQPPAPAIRQAAVSAQPPPQPQPQLQDRHRRTQSQGTEATGLALGAQDAKKQANMSYAEQLRAQMEEQALRKKMEKERNKREPAFGDPAVFPSAARMHADQNQRAPPSQPQQPSLPSAMRPPRSHSPDRVAQFDDRGRPSDPYNGGYDPYRAVPSQPQGYPSYQQQYSSPAPPQSQDWSYGPSQGYPRRDPNQELSNPHPPGQAPHPSARAPGVGPPHQDKKSYAEELQEQMRLNEAKKLEEKRKREESDRKLEAEIASYNPWGKPGAGAAPPKSNQSSPVKGAPPPANAPPGPSGHGARPPTTPQQPIGQFASAEIGDKITRPRQPGEAEKDKAREDLQSYLRKQMEEKEAIKKEQKRKQEEEERKEADRIKRQQEELQKAFEEEQRRAAEKQQKVLEENAKKAAEAEAKRKAAAEALAKQREEATKPPLPPPVKESMQPQRVVSPRPSSPPIPTMRAQQNSPPIPTMRAQQNSPPIPTMRGAAKQPDTQPAPPQPPSLRPPSATKNVEQQRPIAQPVPDVLPPRPPSVRRPPRVADPIPEPAATVAVNPDMDAVNTIMQQLQNLRSKLEREQQKVDTQIRRGEEQFMKLQEHVAPRTTSKPMQAPNTLQPWQPSLAPELPTTHAPKEVKVALPDKEAADALEMFNALKYKSIASNSKAKDAFMNIFPEPPTSATHLDAQQQALIYEQESEIKRLMEQGLAEQPILPPKPEKSARPTSAGGLSLASMASFNLDAVTARNEERLRRLEAATSAQVNVNAEDVLKQFLQRTAATGAKMKDGDDRSLIADTYYRPGSKGSIA